MYCKNCGIQIDFDSKFCRSCGSSQSIQPTLNDDLFVNTDLPAQPKITETNNHNNNIADFLDNERYNKKYKQDLTPVIVGISILCINVITLALQIVVTEEAFKIYSVISLIIRIGITIWCLNIAKTLNRDQTGWGLFAFFIPSIALIIIGLQKQIIYSSNYLSMSVENKSKENYAIAFRLMMQNKYPLAITYLDKSIEQDRHNHDAYIRRGLVKDFLKDFQGALIDFNKSIELNSKNALQYYHRGRINKKLGNMDDAIKDWQLSAQMGCIDAKNALHRSSQ